MPSSNSQSAKLPVAPTSDPVSQAKVRAAALFNKDAENFIQKEKILRRGRWLRTITEAGTTSDRMAAIILMIQQSPMHRLPLVDELLEIASGRNLRSARMAIDSLKDLFAQTLLPPHKLRYFYEHKFESAVTDDQLKKWYFEDAIKAKYTAFIRIVEKAARGILQDFKKFALQTIRDILGQGVAEQSQLWLSILISKLGDPEKEMVNSVTKMLLEISRKDNLKEPLIKELTIFVRKCSPKAKYYGISILGQVDLYKTEVDIANILVVTYFSLFKAVMETPDTDARVLSSLIAGAAKALPIAKVQYAAVEKYTKYLFEVVKTATMINSVKALALLHQVMISNNGTLTDEFYDALYAKLASPSLRKTAALGLLLNLMLKVVKSDSNQVRSKDFVKKLLAASTYGRPNFVCAAVVLLDQLAKEKPEVAKMAFTAPSSTEKGSELLWELVPLRCHYHPAVAKLTELFLSRSPEVYTGQDPLSQYSLQSFLDSFVKEQSVEVSRKNLDNAPLRVIRKLTLQVAQVGGDAPEKAFFKQYFANRPTKRKQSELAKKRAEFLESNTDVEDMMDSGIAGDIDFEDNEEFSDEGEGGEGEGMEGDENDMLVEDGDEDREEDEDDAAEFLKSRLRPWEKGGNEDEFIGIDELGELEGDAFSFGGDADTDKKKGNKKKKNDSVFANSDEYDTQMQERMKRQRYIHPSLLDAQAPVEKTTFVKRNRPQSDRKNNFANKRPRK